MMIFAAGLGAALGGKRRTIAVAMVAWWLFGLLSAGLFPPLRQSVDGQT
jgi:hypothetical protein